MDAAKIGLALIRLQRIRTSINVFSNPPTAVSFGDDGVVRLRHTLSDLPVVFADLDKWADYVLAMPLSEQLSTVSDTKEGLKPCPFCGHRIDDLQDAIHPTGTVWTMVEGQRHYFHRSALKQSVDGEVWAVCCLPHEWWLRL